MPNMPSGRSRTVRKNKGPTFVGDTIHVEAEVTESRASSSDPRRGLVRTRNRIVNQKGETVIIYTPLRLMVGRELLASHREAGAF